MVSRVALAKIGRARVGDRTGERLGLRVVPGQAVDPAKAGEVAVRDRRSRGNKGSKAAGSSREVRRAEAKVREKVNATVSLSPAKALVRMETEDNARPAKVCGSCSPVKTPGLAVAPIIEGCVAGHRVLGPATRFRSLLRQVIGTARGG